MENNDLINDTLINSEKQPQCGQNNHVIWPYCLGELFAALAKAQAEMPIAGLNASNPFFKSKYASLIDLVKASRPSLTKNGLCVSQIITKEGLCTILGHSSGQHLKSIMAINPQKPDIQSLGSYITYLKRYSYAAIVGVFAGDEDDDGEAAMEQERSRPFIPPLPTAPKAELCISSQQLEELQHALADYPEIAENILTRMNLKTLKDMPVTKYRPCMDRIAEIKRDMLLAQTGK